MSANRRMSAMVFEITFEEFLEQVSGRWCRVQGKVESKTRAKGRLVRFNRAVEVYPETAGRNKDGQRFVRARRVKWDRENRVHFVSNEWMTIAWRSLDWLTWQWSGDPNTTWIKVV